MEDCFYDRRVAYLIFDCLVLRLAKRNESHEDMRAINIFGNNSIKCKKDTLIFVLDITLYKKSNLVNNKRYLDKVFITE